MTQIIALVHRTLASARLPVIRLTRWGDLKTKLAAVEAGVNDTTWSRSAVEVRLDSVFHVSVSVAGPWLWPNADWLAVAPFRRPHTSARLA